MKPAAFTLTTGLLCLQSWHGYSQEPCFVVGETPKRYRITPAGPKSLRLAGRHRWLHPGKTALVPKGAIILGRQA